MARNQIIINVDVGETRVALIEDGIVTELHIERKGERSNVGDVYLGRVTRVLPGMNAAFVDIGLERAAFLHSEDVVAEQRLRDTTVFSDSDDSSDDRPASISARGHSRPQRSPAPAPRSPAAVDSTRESEREVSRAEHRQADIGPIDEAPLDEVVHDGHDLVDSEVSTSSDENAEQHEHEHSEDHDALHEPDAEQEASSDLDDHDLDDDTLGQDPPDSVLQESDESELAQEDLPQGDFEDDGESEGFGDLLSDAGAQAEGQREAPAGAPRGPSHGRNGRVERDNRGGQRGRRGQGGNQRPNDQRGAHSRDGRGGQSRDGRGSQGSRDNRGGSRDKRISASGNGARHERKERTIRQPIRDLLREGQEIVVQVSKDPIGTKGARCTSHISLAGRHSVYLPTVEHVGVSKRIGNEKERRRLREVIEQLKPEKGGIIVRTASEGLTKKGLKTDVAYLVTLWNEIWRKREAAKGPTLLYSELDVVLRTVRDVMGPEIEKVVIDDREAHGRCVRFVERFMPERKDDIMLYSGDEPLFDAYGIEDEIARALARKVPLRSGGYLIIDQAEALTAIDVNSGRFVGQKDVEDTVTQTNLEAVEEIAYQLRLRNLGGLVILDLIDMERQGNRDKVYKALAESLNKDKAKTSILRISELGLIEMTRKRTRESLGRQLYEPCFYCDGTGHTSSRQTIAYEVLRQIRREKDSLKGYTIVINAHPAVADALRHEAREAFEEAQRRYQRRIVVLAKPEYHIEQFDLIGQ
jgi:ribonuclease G